MLFIELLHSFGLCLLVFHILPHMDMARGLLSLCGVYTVPAFLKTISVATDSTKPTFKRFSLAFVNSLAFLIQICNLAACTMFSNPLDDTERRALQNEVISSPDVFHTIERPVPTLETNRYMWEIPISLFFISISYWENYVDHDLTYCSVTIPFLQWKRQLNVVRERLNILTGIWKVGWTLAFAVLLLPGFTFNMQFSETKLYNNQSNILEATVSPGVLEKHLGKRSITDHIENHGLGAVKNLTDQSLPSTRYQQSPTPTVPGDITLPTGNRAGISVDTVELKKDESTTSSEYTYQFDLPESVKLNFQRYGPLYLQLISSAVLSYIGSLACKLCMQIFGFSIPIFLATPATLAIILIQCYTKFIPSYLYIWLCPESEGDVRLFHLMWLGVLWVSQIILTVHIWFPKCGRMSKIDRCVTFIIL